MVVRFQQPHFYHVVVERANRSIHQLKCTLGEGEVSVGEDALDPSLSTREGREDTGTSWHELQHSQAGELNVAVALPWMTRREFFKLPAVMTAAHPPLHCYDSIPEMQIS